MARKVSISQRQRPYSLPCRSREEGLMPSGRSITRDCLLMRNLSLALTSLILLLINGSLEQDILFPGERPLHARGVTEITTISKISTISTNTTTPVPAIQCPANMILTADPDETESYCECLTGNLYYPKLDRCFPPYTRGPCEEGEHLILLPNTTIANCTHNPCGKGTVLYNGSCYDLYVTGGPCDSNKTLTIPETSHEPECVEISTVNYQLITAPLKPCAPGSRKTSRGMCRKKLR